MNKRERDEHRSRNYWDQVHAANLMYAMRHTAAPWRADLMEAHLHLVWHFAHEENARLDFYAKHNIKHDRATITGTRGVDQLFPQSVTGVSCNA